MVINLLYFDGCPSWKTAQTNLQSVLKEEQLDDSINPIRIETDEEAAATKFLGNLVFVKAIFDCKQMEAEGFDEFREFLPSTHLWIGCH